MTEGGHEAVRADDDVVPAADMRRLEERVRELERLLGRKTTGLGNAVAPFTAWFASRHPRQPADQEMLRCQHGRAGIGEVDPLSGAEAEYRSAVRIARQRLHDLRRTGETADPTEQIDRG